MLPSSGLDAYWSIAKETPHDHTFPIKKTTTLDLSYFFIKNLFRCLFTEDILRLHAIHPHVQSRMIGIFYVSVDLC